MKENISLLPLNLTSFQDLELCSGNTFHYLCLYPGEDREKISVGIVLSKANKNNNISKLVGLFFSPTPS
jgi:hypothetical protein